MIYKKISNAFKFLFDEDYRWLNLANKGVYDNYSDEEYLSKMFECRLGKKLNLKSPRSFNEKLQWLKLHDRNPIYNSLVDKFTVKKYVSKVLGEEFVIPTLGVWEVFEDIDFEKLPNQFVLKCTHDSGGIVIVKDKYNFDKKNVKKIINASLKRDYYKHGREWPYKNLSRKIIAEQYMTDESGIELKDYKVFTFNGKAYCIQVDYDRFKNHRRNFYDINWNYMPFTTCYPTDPRHHIPKPICLNYLLEQAEKLVGSLGHTFHVRADFYVIADRIYFGELTFYHGSGFEVFYPDEYGYILGNLIHLPTDINN